MRVTNQMITNSSLSNINTNKIHMSIYENQYSTRQKIQNPSDDPVVAVRSLKYQTRLREISQYLDKNIADAYNWMDTTETALTSIETVFSTIYEYCDQGANDTLSTTDRASIGETFKQYKEDILDKLNSDVAGRYLFTGYRTDTALLFNETEVRDMTDDGTRYNMTQNLSFADVTAKTYTKGGTSYTAGKTSQAYLAEAPSQEMANRLQLGYGNLYSESDASFEMSFTDDAGNVTKYVMDTAAGTTTVTTTDKNGAVTTLTPAPPAIKMSIQSTATPPQGDCYQAADNEIILVKETGEVILGKNAYNYAQKNPNISVNMDKEGSSFKEGDVNPINYYECVVTTKAERTANKPGIHYDTPANQEIRYQINYSQKLAVNTMACDAVPMELINKLDEIINAVTAADEMATKIKDVENLMAQTTDKTELANLTTLKDQLVAEQKIKETILQKTFGSGLTSAKKAQATLSDATASHASRYQRLQLTEERLTAQDEDTTELLEENDYVSLEEAIINFGSAQTTYQASLSCAGKILQTSLLDYL